MRKVTIHFAFSDTSYLKAILVGFFALISSFNYAQSSFNKGWEALNKANVQVAVSFFEKSLENDSSQKDKEMSLLALTMIHSYDDKIHKASDYFNQYLDLSNDPSPEVFALLFESGVVGQPGKFKPDQFAMLERLEKDSRMASIGINDIIYRIGLHFTMSFNPDVAQEYFQRLNHLTDWTFLGPFDNVMNSGFDKDLSVLRQHTDQARFQSKYGTEVSWFKPILSQKCGYEYKNLHFLSDNSIFYAQQFFELDSDGTYQINFGYSGSFKLWINDKLVYSEGDKRVTCNDYFKYEVGLKKGINRILVQVGDYEYYNSNFTIQIYDHKNIPLQVKRVNNPENYNKSVGGIKTQPHYAIQKLDLKGLDSKEDLYKILLALAYKRSFEIDKAEELLQEVLSGQPKNYLAILHSVLLYSYSSNTTKQNDYWEKFKLYYPNDKSVIEERIAEYLDQKEKEKLDKELRRYNDIYNDRLKSLSLAASVAILENNIESVLAIVDSIYSEFPDEYDAVNLKYQLEKSYYADVQKSNEVLHKYLETNYSAAVLELLAANYVSSGDILKAEQQIDRVNSIGDIDLNYYRKKINLLTKQQKYDEAIELAELILGYRPSDYSVLNDLGALSEMKKDPEGALEAYLKSVAYFPFSYSTNEKVRELEAKKSLGSFIDELDPLEVIKLYSENFIDTLKRSYNIVVTNRSRTIFKSLSTSTQDEYIIKINDEEAIQQWQKVSFESSSNMNLSILKAKTIKGDGSFIDAERSGNEAVFTNLEIGDFVWVKYVEKQVHGGKSTQFLSDQHAFTLNMPTYINEYNLIIDESLSFIDTVLNGDVNRTSYRADGVDHYQWKVINPNVYPDEPYSTPFSDAATSLHYSLTSDWAAISSWYKDLSSEQARSDFRIKEIVSELFGNGEYSEEEKARMIYDFVITNIQYSYIDFRQSNFIPQKASKVYDTRLGDCKDLSTLYASIAREVGLKVNLVLINTRDNGQYSTYLPSLGFNHCIVKVYFGSDSKYLELTDPNLPYGSLYYYHDQATILEIPYDGRTDDSKLEFLVENSESISKIERVSKIEITNDDTYKVTTETNKSGASAANTYASFINLDSDERSKNMREAISNSLNMPISLNSLEFNKFEPLKDKASYVYSYSPSSATIKVGGYRSFKIPFSDLLFGQNLIMDDIRQSDFDFNSYEVNDEYHHSFEVSLASDQQFVELPENVTLNYEGLAYSLTFFYNESGDLIINRSYHVDLDIVKKDSYQDFSEFVLKIIEAENTHILYK